MSDFACTLVIDSCCDLPRDVIMRDGIYLVEYTYIMSDGPHVDDLYQSVSVKEFYDAMRNGEAPTTSQVALSTYLDVFNKALGDGKPVVFLSFSSGLTGSFDVALMARDQILAERPDAPLRVIDTRLASIAEGLFVYEAIRLLDHGTTADELVKWAEEAKYFIDSEFMVEDLDCLRRGGRIPGTVAVAGAALDVKPLLTIASDGKLSLCGVARGRKKGIKALADYCQKRIVDAGPVKYVFVGNADCPKDAERLKELLHKTDESIIFLESSIGPVIGSHVGSGMLAVTFWGGDCREGLSVSDRIAQRVKRG